MVNQRIGQGQEREKFEKNESFMLHPPIMRFPFASDLRQSGFAETETAN